MSIIIAGDIGGTKTTLALYDLTDNVLDCIKQQTYSSHDFDQFNDILLKFLKKHEFSEIDVITLSVAGPVIEQSCNTTNLPWHISSKAIKDDLKVNHVLLLNDIEAGGYGLLHATDADLIQINPNARTQSGNKAIISIGTGLGQAILFWDGSKHIPCGTEGGHTDFAPLIETDLSLWRYFKDKYREHLSYERLLSGPGIPLIYDYLCSHNKVDNLAPDEDKSAWISHQALLGTNKLCIEAMDIFVRLLANEAANLCLKIFAIGGIFITGGIAPKILPLLNHPNFVKHFVQKGRFEHLMKEIPVWVNKDEQTPLKGALLQGLALIK